MARAAVVPRVFAMAKKNKRKQQRAKERRDATTALKETKAPAEEAAAAPAGETPYTGMDVLMHTLLLVDSYTRATGDQLPGCAGLPITEAGRAVFEGEFALVSHGDEDDPVFDYGNKAALDLFGMSFAQLQGTKSAGSAAEGPDQAERGELLKKALEEGCVRGYSGVRVTSSGRRFRIADATVWTIQTIGAADTMDEDEAAPEVVGQAAVFTEVEWLDDVPEEGAVWRVGEGGAWVPASAGGGGVEEEAPGPEEVAAAQAAVTEQGDAVRALKEEQGLENDDPEVAEAVKELLRRKEALAELEAAAAAAE